LNVSKLPPQVPGMTPEILLWDHDGVLVDTESRYFESTQLALLKWGIHLTRDQWLWGQAQGYWLEQFDFSGGKKPLDYQAIRAFRDQTYLDLLATEDVLVEGAEEILSELGKRSRMGLVTTTTWKILDHIHSPGSLLAHFDHIVSADTCTNLKPHPEPYQKALDLFGVSPERAVAIEDSERGLRSAIAAGIRCIVLKSPFMEGADFDGAEVVLDSIRRVPGALTV